MDVFEAVRTVLAVRRYQDKAVPDEAVRRIVQAGRLGQLDQQAAVAFRSGAGPRQTAPAG
ncbi:MAG: hypothetical protein M3336_17940 [Chloroflexota bacterium]|nr:hypothetical protein [Chloroflexota bacterium]